MRVVRLISGAIVTGINNRPLVAWLPLACVILSSLIVVSCGGKSSANANSSGAGGAAMSAGGATNSGGSAGESAASDGTCRPPAPVAPSSPNTPPSEIGCYVYTDGAWQPIPCDCDLWLRNTVSVPVAVAFSLTFSPANMVPSLTGSPDVEVTFEDADESWYKAWARQPQLLTRPSFGVTTADGMTTVRLGASSVTLDPVSLPGCVSRVPKGSISAPYGTFLSLDMQASLTDASGNLVANDTGECTQPESHPTFSSGGFGGEASDAGPPQ
jgi:hypothetical protein